MATEYTTVTVWVLIDSSGNAVAVEDGGDLVERYADQFGEISEAEGTRTVKLVVRVPLPTVIELTGEVTCEETEAGMRVA